MIGLPTVPHSNAKALLQHAKTVCLLWGSQGRAALRRRAEHVRLTHRVVSHHCCCALRSCPLLVTSQLLTLQRTIHCSLLTLAYLSPAVSPRS